MKKVLLGTTALVSAGLLAQQAQAADPIKLSVGGYQYWGVAYAHNDNNPGTATIPAEPGFNKGDHQVYFDGEIQFKGSTVLDNGLEVGVRFELEGETQADQMDETYAWVKGSFGTLQIGNNDPASLELATAAPYVDYLFNGNSPYFSVNGLSQFFAQTTGLLRSRFAAGAYATFATFPNQAFDNGQLMYFTPVFNGFQFGASYSPAGGETRMSNAYLLPVKTGGSSTSPAFTHGSVTSLAGRYDGQIGDVSVTAAVGWMNMQDKAINNLPTGLQSSDSQAWDAGLVLYYGKWAIGGSYLKNNDWHNVSGTDTTAYDMGITYTSDGPWSAGISWLHQKIDYAAGTLVAASATDKFNAYTLQGGYALGPGIKLDGTLARQTFKDGVVGTTYDTTVVAGGMMINF
jgi:hypothetical protein